MATVQEANAAATSGGGFLLTPVGTTKIFTPELFSEDQRMYFKTADQFVKEQVLPLAEKIEQKDNETLRNLLAKAGELGLLMAAIPERFGGLGLDETTAVLIAEAQSRYGSWSVTFGAHTGIGTLPIVFFGNTAQKEKYLPKLATGELVAAYALTEPGSGSDALGAKTRAVLSEDGKHYILNGSKQFITNGAFADIFVVFAKVDGEKFTGFIVERDTPGFSPGKEEQKMGLRGSSTTTLIFEDAKVPVENVLGEIGKGHKIAFNILNEGRLKLGVGCIGGARNSIEEAIAYAKDRKQFGTAIVDFAMIREKLARMVAVTFANESMAWRTTGLIDARLEGMDHDSDDFPRAVMAAMEEFALEASALKVFGSEALSYCADEAVQIHGGYGFIEEYSVERAYRDVRVNRIFEGTNEINRMLITGMLLKKAMKGQLPLLDYAMALEQELEAGQLPEKPAHALGAEAFAAECIKRLALYAVKVGVETFGPEIEKHQDVLSAASDAIMEAYAVDSMVARTLQSGETPNPVMLAITRLYTMEAHERAFSRARRAIAASVSGEELEKHLKRIEQLYRFQPYNPAELRETIVTAAVERGGYPLAIA